MNELRPVVGYEGLYGVTDDGRVWAFPKRSRSVGRWLRPFTTRHGYRYVPLFDGKRRNVGVHRIVALAWIPGAAPGLQVNHIDGVKANNCVANLEWCTPQENKQHAFRTGITKLPPRRRAGVHA